jgi:hypothetical protein
MLPLNPRGYLGVDCEFGDPPLGSRAGGSSSRITPWILRKVAFLSDIVLVAPRTPVCSPRIARR